MPNDFSTYMIWSEEIGRGGMCKVSMFESEYVRIDDIVDVIGGHMGSTS